ncbi:DNA alkylation repair protein [Thalassospira sp. MA62]|nr:DNA alkylation repair protein [Thalassospira sp. MA62]
MADTDTGFKRFYDARCAYAIAEMIDPIYSIDANDYAAEVQRLVGPLELKDRVYVLADGLRKRLPDDFKSAIQIIVQSLKPEIGEDEGMFNAGWYLMPIARFVEEFGLEYPELSLDALEEITKRHTAEFGIRPFIENHYTLTMEKLQEWAKSPNAHLRRAASECTRTRLPWRSKLTIFIENPKPVLSILEHLRSDPSDYVRKSVGNNLNDLSKDWPDVVMDEIEKWLAESPTIETKEISKRALRSLLKKGHQRAFTLIGATGGNVIEVLSFQISPEQIQVGESIKMDLELFNPDDFMHNLTIDYVIHHVRSKGQTNPKVFRFTSIQLKPKEERLFSKKHRVKEVTVRAYYAGPHRVDVVVNGIVKASSSFDLKGADV